MGGQMPPTKGSPRPSNPDKVALISGASRGLGRVLAGFLAGQGYALVVTARGKGELATAVDGLREKGPRVVSIPGDVSDAGHRARLLRAVEEFGRLDLLLNNASDLRASPLPPLVRARRAGVVRVFDVNLLAPLELVQEALPILSRSHGLVVNITSDAATGGDPGGGGDGASKAAPDLVSRALPAGLKDEGGGVAG